jgi:hypothetical protein
MVNVLTVDYMVFVTIIVFVGRENSGRLTNMDGKILLTPHSCGHEATSHPQHCPLEWSPLLLATKGH